MLEDYYEGWIKEVNEMLHDIPDTRTKLYRYAELFCQAIEYPIVNMLPESYWGTIAEHFRERLRACYEKDDQIILAIFSEAIARNELSRTNPNALTWIFISMLEGMFAEMVILGDKQNNLDAYFMEGVQIFLDSIYKIQ